MVAERTREARARFLRRHADAVYDALTVRRSRFVRVEDLVIRAAGVVPGLVPTAQEIAAEDGLLQRDKSGLEIDQGVFLAAVLGSERSGRHLCHAMLLPRPEAEALLPQFERDGAVKLAGASVQRAGKAAVVTQDNPRFLNAEDQSSLDGAEICVDLALLDRASEVAVMRGGVVAHPKYAGRRVFGAGINLTHLYHGRIPFVWFLKRDLGYVNKIYRGLAVADDAPPDEFGGRSIEKPWIAAVEAFAIGGHCQLLLVMDYVLAERSAFLTLPARKEGIIPGAANMRMPRFTGDRIARQAIQYERRLECDSPEGRMICDELVEPGAMDAALERVVAGLTSSGVVSAAGNRRAIRIAQEPLDMCRAYFAVYAREQAYCHFSPALIANLERYWNAQSRKP
jgi:thioesterase DpgC